MHDLKKILALEYAYAVKIRMYELFLTLNKMITKIFCFSKISNNLGIRSESSHLPRLIQIVELFEISKNDLGRVLLIDVNIN